MRTTFSVAVVACLASACARPGEFRPVIPGHAVHTFGEGIGGAAKPGGGYVPDSPGTVRVRSEGAYPAHVNGQPATVLQVGLDVDNPTSEDVVIESLHLDTLRLDDGRMMDVPPIRIDGPQIVPSGRAARLHAYFRFPAAEEPDDIDGFTVGWTLRQGDVRYRQRSEFRDREPPLQPPRNGARARP